MVIADLHGSIQYVNPGFVNTTGYAAEEVLGSNPRAYNPAFAHQCYRQMYPTLLRGRVCGPGGI